MAGETVYIANSPELEDALFVTGDADAAREWEESHPENSVDEYQVVTGDDAREIIATYHS